MISTLGRVGIVSGIKGFHCPRYRIPTLRLPLWDRWPWQGSLLLHNVRHVSVWNCRDRLVDAGFIKQHRLWIVGDHSIGLDFDRIVLTFEMNEIKPLIMLPLSCCLTTRPQALLPPPLSLDGRPERLERDAELFRHVSPPNRPPPRLPRDGTLGTGQHQPIVFLWPLLRRPLVADRPIVECTALHCKHAPSPKPRVKVASVSLLYATIVARCFNCCNVSPRSAARETAYA